MWSVALIVGVAIASSVAMLIIGVTLAIRFERRRYRKYIQRHTAGVDVSAPEANALDNIKQPSLTTGARIPPCQVASQNTSDASIITSSSDVSNRNANHEIPSSFPKSEPTIEREGSLRKTLRGPIKKKHRRSRKRKRTVASQFLKTSPLSIIVESDNSCQSLADALDARRVSTINRQPRTLSESPTPVLNTLSVTKIRTVKASVGKSPTRDSLTGSSGIGRSSASLRPTVVIRSLSSTSTSSSAPEDPLPPLPPIDQDKHDTSVVSKVRVSSTSIDSVSSSVLDTPKSILRVQNFVNNPQAHAQGLLDFDFGLEPEKVVRKQSPAKLTPRGRSDPRIATVTSLRASVDPCLDYSLTNKRDLSESSRAAGPSFPETKTTKDRPVRSRSMFEPQKDAGRQIMTLMSGAVRDVEDPFWMDVPLRPKSVEVKSLMQKFEDQDQPQRNSSCSLGANKKGHRRQNCIRISNLPLVSTPGRITFPKITDIEEERFLEGSSPQNLKRYAVDFTGDEASDSSIIRLFPLPAPSQSIICKRSVPSTSELIQRQYWQYNVTLPDQSEIAHTPDRTPPRSPSNTPSRLRFENSPILPSPAYTVAKLHRQPQSQVKGPRSPRERDRGSSKGSLKPYSMGSSSRSASPFKRVASSDHRKSSRKLGSIDSGNWFLSSNEQSARTRSDDLGGILSSSSSTSVGTDLRDGARSSSRTTTLKTSSRIPVPTSGLSPLREKQIELLQPQNPQGMSASFVRSSISGNSIWEDVSVHDDDNHDNSPSTPVSTRKSYPRSPHPEMPTPTKRNQVLAQLKDDDHNSNRLSASPSPSPHTPRTKLEDYEAYENFINSYGEQ